MTRVEANAAKFALKRTAPFFIAPCIPFTSITELFVATIHLYRMRKDVYALARGHDGTSLLNPGHHGLAINRNGSWSRSIVPERDYMRLTDTKAFFYNSGHLAGESCSRSFSNWTDSVARRGLVPESIKKAIGLAHRICNRHFSPQCVLSENNGKIWLQIANVRCAH